MDRSEVTVKRIVLASVKGVSRGHGHMKCNAHGGRRVSGRVVCGDGRFVKLAVGSAQESGLSQRRG